jgi:hypothetical protein
MFLWWLLPQLILLLLKWKHNNINKRAEKTNERLVCKKTNLSWISSISRLIYSWLHRRRRQSTCGAVSCPNGLIYLCASSVSLNRNIFFFSLLFRFLYKMRVRERRISISSCRILIYIYISIFFFSSMNNVQEKGHND